MTREKPDRTTYQITKYNFRDGGTIEVYPKLVRGLANAQGLVESLDRQLTTEEKENGISWFLKKATRLDL